jgi:predicted nucleotidyltransferase
MVSTNLQPRIPIDREALSRFCEKWGIVRLELFGSVLRDDFGPESDVDVLITLEPGREFETGFELVEMQWELEALFGRKVDVLTRRSVERSYNTVRSESVLAGAVDVVTR